VRIFVSTITQKQSKMKLVKTSDRITQVKQGNKILFEVIANRKLTRFSGVKSGLGIVLECKSIDECVGKTLNKLNIINEDFKNRLITL